MTPLYHPRPERWPQFSLKGLLIAVTLSALMMPLVRAYDGAIERRKFNRARLLLEKDKADVTQQLRSYSENPISD